MSDPRAEAARAFVRRHLEQARIKGAITAEQFAAATDHLLARELDERILPDGTLPFDSDRASLIRFALAELQTEGVLDEETVRRAVKLEPAPDPLATPMALLPIESTEVPTETAPQPAGGLTILCPHCEAPVPDGQLDCVACGQSILIQVDPETLEPAPAPEPEELPTLSTGADDPDGTDRLPSLAEELAKQHPIDPIEDTDLLTPVERTRRESERRGQSGDV